MIEEPIPQTETPEEDLNQAEDLVEETKPGKLRRAKDWCRDNWKWIATGGLVVAGVVAAVLLTRQRNEDAGESMVSIENPPEKLANTGITAVHLFTPAKEPCRPDPVVEIHYAEPLLVETRYDELPVDMDQHLRKYTSEFIRKQHPRTLTRGWPSEEKLMEAARQGITLGERQTLVREAVVNKKTE